MIAYFCDRAAWWREQAGRRADVSSELRRGLAVYAEKQATVLENLVDRCASLWVPHLKSCGPLPEWALPYQHKCEQRSRGRVTRELFVDTDGSSDLSSTDHSDAELL